MRLLLVGFTVWTAISLPAAVLVGSTLARVTALADRREALRHLDFAGA